MDLDATEETVYSEQRFIQTCAVHVTDYNPHRRHWWHRWQLWQKSNVCRCEETFGLYTEEITSLYLTPSLIHSIFFFHSTPCDAFQRSSLVDHNAPGSLPPLFTWLSAPVHSSLSFSQGGSQFTMSLCMNIVTGHQEYSAIYLLLFAFLNKIELVNCLLHFLWILCTNMKM